MEVPKGNNIEYNQLKIKAIEKENENLKAENLYLKNILCKLNKLFNINDLFYKDSH